MLLLVAAASLLVAGSSPAVFLWSRPARWRRGLAAWWRRQAGLRKGWNQLTQPLWAWIIGTSTFWVWHLPGLYDLALEKETVHPGGGS